MYNNDFGVPKSANKIFCNFIFDIKLFGLFYASDKV